MQEKLIIGCLEQCDLLEWGIEDLTVRVDTGAKTSSLHVNNIRACKLGSKPAVKFDLHPDIYNVETVLECQAIIKDVRRVKSSNGAVEQRYVISTPITLGGHSWPVEITLTDRSDMSYLMLLGREGMANRVLVDPSQSFILEKK